MSTSNTHPSSPHLGRRQFERASRTASRTFYEILVAVVCVAIVDVVGLLVRFGVF